jgi:hypothetical protein
VPFTQALPPLAAAGRFSASTHRRLLWLAVFAVAMAQLEAAVVVYLRQIFYPEGFSFPLKVITGRIAWTEIGREAATLTMILALARLSARDPWRRFAAFLFVFGVWDVFYYLWLWVLLAWPPSLFTWDILFLIPLPWVGPVWAPLLISLCMIVSAMVIFSLRDRYRSIRVHRWEWTVVVLSALLLVLVFVWPAASILDGAVPEGFPWLLFLMVLSPAVAVALRAWNRAEGPRRASRIDPWGARASAPRTARRG